MAKRSRTKRELIDTGRNKMFVQRCGGHVRFSEPHLELYEFPPLTPLGSSPSTGSKNRSPHARSGLVPRTAGAVSRLLWTGYPDRSLRDRADCGS